AAERYLEVALRVPRQPREQGRDDPRCVAAPAGRRGERRALARASQRQLQLLRSAAAHAIPAVRRRLAAGWAVVHAATILVRWPGGCHQLELDRLPRGPGELGQHFDLAFAASGQPPSLAANGQRRRAKRPW